MELDKQGIEHELNFWKWFITTDRFLKDWCSKERTTDLVDEVYLFLKGLNPSRVLDIGSGPVSILHGTIEPIIMCDPLGEHYGKLVDYEKLKLTPPEPMTAEELNPFPMYSIVHCSNALDHTQDILKSFNNLCGCVAFGGSIILQGFVNEATHENQSGFHQWDIGIIPNSDRLYFYHVKEQRFIDPGIPDGFKVVLAKKTTLPSNGRDWFVWIAERAFN